MQNQKLCSKCQVLLPFAAFNRRSASHDGLQPRCRECKRAQDSIDYWGDPEQNARQKARTIKNRQLQFQDPAFKRAFYLWGSTRKRTKIPPWVCIRDFVPICQAVIDAGPGHQLDHIVPIKGKLVCGLHVPSNMRVVTVRENQIKFNSHDT